MKLSSAFSVTFVALLAGCQTAPAPKAAIVAKPSPPLALAPKEPKEVNNNDVGDILNIDVSKPIADVPAKMFPKSVDSGYCLTLANNIGMPSVALAQLKNGTILQITARVCNRGLTPRSLDFLCQVNEERFHYHLDQVPFPAYKARDIRLRIYTPQANSTVWLTVRDTRNKQILGPSDSSVPQPTGTDNSNVKVSTMVQDPAPDNKK
jgi:hypothetical protein